MSNLSEAKHLVGHKGAPALRSLQIQSHHALNPAFPLAAHTATLASRGRINGLVNTFGSKLHHSVGNLTKYNDQYERQLALSLDFNLPAMQRRKHAKLAKKAASDFNGLATTLKSAFRNAYKDAYSMGLASNGLSSSMSADEVQWVESAFSHEMKYFNNLLKEVKAGKSVYSQPHRIKMYARTLHSIYDSGRIMGGHPHALIWWKPDPKAQHCSDCLTLAKLSPFTRDTLPFTPRSGSCRCLGNCRCNLQVQASSLSMVQAAQKANLSKRYLLRKLKRSK